MRGRLQTSPIAARTPRSFELPEVVAPSLDALRVKVPLGLVPDVTEQDVDNRLEVALREGARITMRSEQDPIELDDEVLIDFVARREGVLVPGTFRANVVVPMTDQAIFPELVPAICGKHVSQRVSVDVILPHEGDTKYGGKRVRLSINIRGARRVHLPDPRDAEALAKLNLGPSLDAVRAHLRGDLERERMAMIECAVENLVLDALVARAKVEVPADLLQISLRNAWLAAEGRAMALAGVEFHEQQASFVNYCSDLDVRADHERRIRIALVLGAIARRDNVQLEERAIEDALAACAREMGVDLSAQEVMDPGTSAMLADRLLHLRMVDYATSRAEITFE